MLILFKLLRLFCETLCAAPFACCCPTGARLPRFRRTAPHHLYKNIDAWTSESVIRRTLLRYTPNSRQVNNFLVEILCKLCPAPASFLPLRTAAISAAQALPDSSKGEIVASYRHIASGLPSAQAAASWHPLIHEQET